MKARLKVKTESLPERCEICHQADCFDPHSQYCTRCVGLPHPNPAAEPQEDVPLAENYNTYYQSAMRRRWQSITERAKLQGIQIIHSQHSLQQKQIRIVNYRRRRQYLPEPYAKTLKTRLYQFLLQSYDNFRNFLYEDLFGIPGLIGLIIWLLIKFGSLIFK
ncbi:MAG: hypothetical protein AB1489_34650 [Acidobacteriota bacterium]